MKLGKKVLIACLGVLLFAVLEYVLFYVFHYVRFYDYEDSQVTYNVEEGKAYSPIKADAVDNYDLVSENGSIKFYLNPETGEVAVNDIKNDQWYYSTPSEIDSDTVANETNKARLKSQLVIKYFNTSRNEGTYNTFSEVISVDPNQLTVQSIDNGVRCTYYFKQKMSDSEVVPWKISKERYEGFFDKISDASKKTMGKIYVLNDDEDAYEVTSNMQSNPTKFAKQFGQAKKILYDEAGYTDADLAVDTADSDLDQGGSRASFKVALEYRLTEDGLQVNLPTSLIEENNGSIYTIEVLPGFAAASSADEGYFVVPNGSGSLIDFNNARDAQYSAFIYGIDPISANYTKVENADTVRLPIYGICFDKNSVFAEVENGASLGQISTKTAGSAVALSSYNTASFTFALRGRETLDMFGTSGEASNIPIVEKVFADCNIQISYNFLGEEYKGYSGIANYYREKLVKNGTLTANGDLSSTKSEDIGFYYDLIGAVKTTDFFLGVQYLGVEAMTTFAQAKEIANVLSDAGIKNQIINYQGWFNGGYYHDVTDKVKLIRKLGSESSFEELASYVEGLGGKVYAEAALQKVTDISKRYVITYEAAKYYSGYSLELGITNPTTLRQTAGLGYSEVLYSVVSPKFLVRYVDKFISKTEDIDVTGLSLRDLGDVLSSDKKRTEIIDREYALNIVKDQLAKFDENGDKQLMISGGNDYAVSVADDLINVPIGENNYYSVNKEVPLYEMIYHGYVDYACYDINTSDTYNVDDISLRLIEYGCSPHFVFTYDEANEMKYTGVNSVYSSTFETWKDTAIEIYNKVNDALKSVKNAEIKAHEELETGVKKVTYSNGVVIYINTTDKAVTVDGASIEANSYSVKGVN